jgi:NodT family efflux transporter outer membrane factor (OMF) lipoprotein
MKTPATAGRLARHALLAAALALTGCAVGPDFERPRPPTVQRYTTTDVVVVPADAREAAQHVADGATIPAGWWELFHSPPLDDVLRQAIAGNQTVAAAEATLLAARQAVLAAEGAFYPQVDFGASYTREHNGARSGTSSTGNVVTGGFNLYSLGPTVSYAPDVFGGTRRQVEEQSALAEKQHYQLAAAYLTLTGNAATQALAIASARMQLDAAQSIIDDDERNATLVRQKRDAGKAADVDVLTAESQLAVDRTQIPPLRQQLSVARHALAVLVGRFPAEWSAPDFDLAELTLPETLPATLPSELVHQRPDILAAEAQLHADSAAVGVATAQMYPSFTLSAALSGEPSRATRPSPGRPSRGAPSAASRRRSSMAARCARSAGRRSRRSTPLSRPTARRFSPRSARWPTRCARSSTTPTWSTPSATPSTPPTAPASCSASATRRASRISCSSSTPSGSTSKRASATRVRRHSATRTRCSSSSRWAAAGGSSTRRGSRPMVYGA